MKLSVIAATRTPWPAARVFLGSISPQLRDDPGIELILADGNAPGAGVPPGVVDRLENCRHITEPGASVFGLRRRALEQARGELIAVTEDHCRVEESWCRKILDHFDRYPAAVMLGGGVVNGSRDTIFDRINFLMTFSRYIPPFGGAEPRAPALSNLAFRTQAVREKELADGAFELDFLHTIVREHGCVFRDDLQVTHVQSHGAYRTFLVHFHNGRSTTGLVSARMNPLRRICRGVQAVMLPLFHMPSIARNIHVKGQIGLSAIPLHLLGIGGLVLFHQSGELVGLVAGAGQSPKKLV